MGLDGLSVNNLRLTQENTSKENAIVADVLANSEGNFSRSVNQLAKKGSIESGKDKENTSFAGGFANEDDEEEKGMPEEDDSELVDVYEDAARDFPEEDDFTDETDETCEQTDDEIRAVIEKINPQSISKLVVDLKQVSGVLINKKV